MPRNNAHKDATRIPSTHAGFTLIEMIVSLAVLSVATGIFVGMYGRSVSLGKVAEHRRAAAALAEEQLSRIAAHPEQFLWLIQAPGSDETFEIKLGEDDPPAGNLFSPPDALPVEEAAYAREEARHSAYRWHARGRLRSGAPYYEVTVIVNWEHQGEREMLAVTGAAPRGPVDTSRHGRSLEAEASPVPPETSETSAADTDAAAPMVDPEAANSVVTPAEPAAPAAEVPATAPATAISGSAGEAPL